MTEEQVLNRLRSLKPLANARFPRRLKFLQGECRKIWLKTPLGLSAEVAQQILQHFKGVFGDITIEHADRRKTWVFVVSWFRCPRCKREFDEKDFRGTYYGKGQVRCPGCGEVVEDDGG